MKREYPDRPIVGVGGVVIDRHRALLIRRGSEPHKGAWSIPGGMLELGEELAEGVRRELKEETGLEVEPLEIVAAFDRITWKGSASSTTTSSWITFAGGSAGGLSPPPTLSTPAGRGGKTCRSIT